MSAARVGVVTFPGTLDDQDAARAVRLVGAEAVPLWHADHDLKGVDAVFLPGGFSYGDYLRCGAISRFAPLMEELVPAARAGLPVLGTCNGFQILCEARLLPGALTRNASLHYVCRDQRVRVESTDTAWTNAFAPGQELVLPIKHAEGRYVASPETIAELEANQQVVMRYIGNPNGAIDDIAGVRNESGTIVGIMPHPEHAMEDLVGAPSTDGRGFFTSILKKLVNA
ncbi:phosphoribosylformylglycinamidine synthase subunit PurQ [Nonomuraea sp. NPDC050536]|uniref:phosphoribosylformylglycinamidine synthase subunit PurQ n=1 Tax=Nonomuraea sp. NPDC050536 TaxID=3364366 RepID=UPI0037C81C29